jgi:hypothetical protein
MKVEHEEFWFLVGEYIDAFNKVAPLGMFMILTMAYFLY